MTEKGVMPVAVFSVDGKEILDCVADITRGLLKHFYPQFNYHGHDFMVVDIHSATLAKGQRGCAVAVNRRNGFKNQRRGSRQPARIPFLAAG